MSCWTVCRGGRRTRGRGWRASGGVAPPTWHARWRPRSGPAGGVTLTALDPDYPAALRVTDPRPPVLYCAGDAAAFVGPAVAVVGTRRATGYGRSAAQEIADELARAGVTVVSGLAIGIDGEAHAAALAAGGRSVAVLPSPLDRIYPPRHRQLAARLVAEGGALLSELAPGPQSRPAGLRAPQPDHRRAGARHGGGGGAGPLRGAADGGRGGGDWPGAVRRARTDRLPGLARLQPADRRPPGRHRDVRGRAVGVHRRQLGCQTAGRGDPLRSGGDWCSTG